MSFTLFILWLQTLKLELELKEEKVASLSRELADLSFTGRAEEEVAALKKAKHDLEMRVKDQVRFCGVVVTEVVVVVVFLLHCNEYTIGEHNFKFKAFCLPLIP